VCVVFDCAVLIVIAVFVVGFFSPSFANISCWGHFMFLFFVSVSCFFFFWIDELGRAFLLSASVLPCLQFMVRVCTDTWDQRMASVFDDEFYNEEEEAKPTFGFVEGVDDEEAAVWTWGCVVSISWG
jgi:hypothetical protein